MAYPLVATLSGTVTWSDATPFNGFAVFTLKLPGGRAQATVTNQLFPQEVGRQIRVRVQNGAYDQSTRLIYNAALDPPNSTYSGQFFTDTDELVGAPTADFTVTGSPVTPPAVTLTKPT